MRRRRPAALGLRTRAPLARRRPQSYALPVWVCAQCGVDDPGRARFRNACAASLAPEALACVRRTVTVLICDVLGLVSLA
jgi:hypothetical protein